ncbi:MAG TPA: hypothetical protein VFU53_08015, partial [Burkholderiales bacterium]|nr:hypothetical protein [Burkholderiales bacterium]
MTSVSSAHPLRLAHGLRLEDLYEREGLLRVDAAFVAHLEQSAPLLAEALRAARADPDAVAPLQESELLIALAPYLDDFVAELFGIQAEVRALSAQHHALAPLYAVKRSFVQRRAMARIKPDEAATLDGAALESELTAAMGGVFTELGFAQRVSAWLEDDTAFAAQLELAARYAAWAAHTAAGRARHRAGV